MTPLRLAAMPFSPKMNTGSATQLEIRASTCKQVDSSQGKASEKTYRKSVVRLGMLVVRGWNNWIW
jgi:hypothetical protein